MRRLYQIVLPGHRYAERRRYECAISDKIPRANLDRCCLDQPKVRLGRQDLRDREARRIEQCPKLRLGALTTAKEQQKIEIPKRGNLRLASVRIDHIDHQQLRMWPHCAPAALEQRERMPVVPI